MANVLLITPPTIRPRAALAYALDLATQKVGRLVGLVLLDPAESARIAASLDSAFMGERVSDRVIEVLTREQHGQAETVLEAIAAQARARGVPFVPLIEEGDPDEVCARVIRVHDVDAAVLVAEKRSWLSRILSRSAAVQMPAMANCALTVMEEEPGNG